MRVQGWVWCDHYGLVHEDIDDPQREGPVYDWPGAEESLAKDKDWKLRTDPTWPDEKMWHFTCPGPHFELETVGG